MIGNQVCFSQLTQELPLELVDEQVHQLLRHAIKQGPDFVSQGCKLHSENRELIIMLHVKSFPFFHVGFTLQMILVVFVKEAKQVWIGLKIQVIIAVLFVVQNVAYFIT